MLENVIDLGLKPKRPYAKRSKTNLIILHHASGATPKTRADEEQTVRGYHQMHISKGNRGIDYNFLVGPLGNVYKGRGLEFEGGHVLNSGKSAGMNARSVGICALGNLEANKMPEAQKEAIKRLVWEIARHYGIKEIIKHKDVKNTDCPGKYFPFDEVKAFALEKAETGLPPTGIIEPQPVKPDEYPPTYKVVVGELNFRERPDMKAKVIRVLRRGDLVKLDRYVKGEKWARVIYGGAIGWVWLDYIGER